ncbi:MAG: hypothetical protein QM681_06210 [Novosphingobium sp.]
MSHVRRCVLGLAILIASTLIGTPFVSARSGLQFLPAFLATSLPSFDLQPLDEAPALLECDAPAPAAPCIRQTGFEDYLARYEVARTPAEGISGTIRLDKLIAYRGRIIRTESWAAGNGQHRDQWLATLQRRFGKPRVTGGPSGGGTVRQTYSWLQPDGATVIFRINGSPYPERRTMEYTAILTMETAASTHLRAAAAAYAQANGDTGDEGISFGGPATSSEPPVVRAPPPAWSAPH